VISEATKRKGIPASQVIKEIMSSLEASEADPDSRSEAEQRKSTILQKFSPNTIKAILELLCDESVCIIHNIVVRTAHIEALIHIICE